MKFLLGYHRHVHLEMTNCFGCNICDPWHCSSQQNLVSKPISISGTPRRLSYKILLFYYLNCGEFTTERVTVHRGIRIWPHRIHSWTPAMLMEVLMIFLTSSGRMF